MRRNDRELKTVAELTDVLESGSVAQVAFIQNNAPYIVSLNYGFSVNGTEIKLFFHSAGEGRKIDCIKSNPDVCFTVAICDPLIEGEEACDYSMKFRSVVGYGKMRLIEDEDEKIFGLNRIMNHYTRVDTWDYNKEMLKNTTVICLDAESITGKRKS
ncbi:MAG: pyridoxamine 5'-phosphate oxidase family protein [Ignavibacteriaceae bacterium]